MTGPAGDELARKAGELMLAHHGDRPLLLPNAWDVASALAVSNAGFPVVATSSRAIAQVLGEADDDSSDPDLLFSYTSRIVRAVTVPVTADLQAGFRLSPAELVDRLLDAGLVGCNLEDTDHHGDSVLLDPDRQASYLADVRAAAARRGVHIVVNARVDTFVRQFGDQTARVDEAVRRARLYLQAGADCAYPIAVSSAEDAGALVAAVPGPLNLLARRGGLSIDA
ncbi:MAG: isocitrate lyase/PEP mutase family protein, partial [Solirubrobacteraceae bacterium]